MVGLRYRVASRAAVHPDVPDHAVRAIEFRNRLTRPAESYSTRRPECPGSARCTVQARRSHARRLRDSWLLLGAIVERQVRHRIRATSLPAPDYADRSRAHQNDIAGTVPAVREMGAVTRANCDIALRLAPKHTRAE